MSKDVNICGVVPEVEHSAGAATARDMYRLEHRLGRLYRKGEALQGKTMSLEWYHWFEEWFRCREALHEVKYLRGEL